MDSDTALRIFIAAIGVGIGGEGLRQWRAYKLRRSFASYAERNVGFWTDQRIRAAERIVLAALIIPPVVGIVAAIATNFLSY